MFIGHLHHRLRAFSWLWDFYLFSLFPCPPFQMIFSFLLLLFHLLAARSLSLGSCKSRLLSANWLFSRPDLHVFLTLLSLPSSTWKYFSPLLLGKKKFKNWTSCKTTRKKKIFPYWVPASIIILHQKTYSWTQYQACMDVIFPNFWKKMSNGILLPRHHCRHHSRSSWLVFCQSWSKNTTVLSNRSCSLH